MRAATSRRAFILGAAATIAANGRAHADARHKLDACLIPPGT